MQSPPPVGSDEKIGFSIKSTDVDKPLKRGYIVNQLLGHLGSRTNMSTDRVSLSEQNDELGVVIDAANTRLSECDHRLCRQFQGWAMFKVSRILDKYYRVEPDPDDRYHANIEIDYTTADHVKEKRQLAHFLADIRCWRPKPANTP